MRPYIKHSHTSLVLHRSSVSFRSRAGGTHSAMLVDTEGKVASEVAVGVPAVPDPARARRSGSAGVIRLDATKGARSKSRPRCTA
jgi:hypothetical protein